jgi:short-subunit dehydrogenase
MELKGKKVWLTGASSGIGKALAAALAKEGSDLFLTARDQNKLEQLKEQIQNPSSKIVIAAGDVCDHSRMQEIVSQFGPFDVLVANAGTYLSSEMSRFNASEYLKQLEVNFGGLLYCMESVLPGMIAKGSGLICGNSSVVGYRGSPKAAAYGASKAAMTNFLESARFDLAPMGIKVSIISPGFVKTPLTDKNRFRMPFLVSSEYAARKIIDGIKKEKLEIHFPWQFSWLCKFFRVIPFPFYNWLISRSPLVK